MAHPTVYNRVETLAKFRNAVTLKEADVSTYIAKRLLADGLIDKAGKVLTGNRGRPAILFLLTPKGVEALNPVTPVATVQEQRNEADALTALAQGEIEAEQQYAPPVFG